MKRDKTRYVATFSNGYTVSRTSRHAYTHAWHITVPNIVSTPAYWCTGFASSEELARKAAIKTIPRQNRESNVAACTIEVVPTEQTP